MKTFKPAQLKISAAQKRLSARAMMTSGLAILLSATAAHADPAVDALPTGGVVIGGTSSTIGAPAANTLTITQHEARSVLEWQTYDIGAKAHVKYVQNAGDVSINRVVTNDTAEIYGKLSAGGTVVILDQNGVVFGPNAKISVGGIVASTGSVTDANALSGGALVITGIDAVPNASVINNSKNITVADSGLLAFVAPFVENNGTINAKLGKVTLASGSKATIDFSGDTLVQIAVSDKVADGLVKNTGTINANGGIITLAANTAKGVLDTVVNNTGILRADTYKAQDGKIILSGGGAKTALKGTVSAEDGIFASGATIDITGKLTLDKGNLDLSAGTINLAGSIVSPGGALRFSPRLTRPDWTVWTVNVLNDNASVRQGIALASAWGTVNISAGTYDENLVIDKPLRIFGDGTLPEISGDAFGGKVIEITSDDVTIEGLTIDGEGRADYGIYAKAVSGLRIAGNFIENIRKDGIRIFGFGDTESNLTISGNAVTNAGRDGISLENFQSATIDGNYVFADGDNAGAGRDGIHLKNVNLTFVNGNFVLGNDGEHGAGRDGIHAEGFDHGEIRDNVIGLRENADLSGIPGWEEKAPSLFSKILGFLFGDHEGWGSSALGAGRDGISVDDGDDAGIRDNVISHYGEDGVQLSNSTYIAIERNQIDGISPYNHGFFSFSTTTGIRLWNNNEDGHYGEGFFGFSSPDSGNNNTHVRDNGIFNNAVGLDAAANNNTDGLFLSGNTFGDNIVGAQFASGLIDLTGETNTFDGGMIGMMFKRAFVGYPELKQERRVYEYEEGGDGDEAPAFDPYALLALEDDTIGTTVFTGQSYRYVKLLGDALFAPGAPTIIDGTNATYDGVHGGVMTALERDAIEAMLLDFDDQGTQGQIFVGGPNFGINNNDVFWNTDAANYLKGKVQVFTTGGPGGGQPQNPADIEPAAGGEGNEGGDGATPVSCWSNVGGALGTQTEVSLDIGGDPASLLDAEASCTGGETL